MGLAPPMELQEYMADQRWVRTEARRLLPKTDGMYLYIWTKEGLDSKKGTTRRGALTKDPPSRG